MEMGRGKAWELDLRVKPNTKIKEILKEFLKKRNSIF